MAAPGSNVTSEDMVVRCLVPRFRNLAGPHSVLLSGKSSRICRRAHILRIGEANWFPESKRLTITSGSLFHKPQRIAWMQSYSCYSNRAGPEVSVDASLSMEQLSSPALSAEKSENHDTLKLVSGSCYLPHPDKLQTGGEDAHFICADEQAVGVADGVGGWADLGIDSGEYARQLMSNSVEAIKQLPDNEIDLMWVLEKAYGRTQAMGSSTACIIALKDQDLHAINLGDSGFIIIRDGRPVFESPVQQHGFNFPYQLERSGEGDLPSSGQVFKVPVVAGDVVVAGSDGLFDNMYARDIAAIVSDALKEKLGPDATAARIAASARTRALDSMNQTPFSAAALHCGISYFGGKLDDLTVLVSYVSPSTS